MQPSAASAGRPASRDDAVDALLSASRDDVVDAPPSASRDDVVDALLSASRAMVGLAARSLADLDSDVTLPQYRALVVLASRGPQRVVDIAAELGVNPSTGTRMCDRLVRKGLMRRNRTAADRRVVRLTLTKDGRRLVEQVTAHRRDELTRVVEGIADHWHGRTVAALRAFAAAAGEVPEQEWWLGWATTGEDAGQA